MSDEPVKLSYEEAVGMLPDNNTIHVFYNIVGKIVGRDIDRDAVLFLIRNGAVLSGPLAASMGHKIAVIDNGGWVFVETKSQIKGD